MMIKDAEKVIELEEAIQAAVTCASRIVRTTGNMALGLKAENWAKQLTNVLIEVEKENE